MSKLRYAPVVTEASFGERMTHVEWMDGEAFSSSEWYKNSSHDTTVAPALFTV